MRSLRRSTWLQAVSFLLLALLVPAQAAACCKLGALFGIGLGNGPVSAPAPAESEDQAMAADHSCCPKPAGPSHGSPSADAVDPVDSSCEPGGTGCCLEMSGAAEPGLLSSPAPSAKAVALSRGPTLPAMHAIGEEKGVPSGVPERAEGPPLYLLHRSLLI